MLYEIRSNVFRTKQIRLHGGLNVVLGDENATNSIGKSTLLMVVDFGFGGNSLLEHNKDLVAELGDHDYVFTFRFGADLYRFRRGTNEPNLVHVCDENYEPESVMRLEEYTAFLMHAYGIDLDDISFRALVGLFIRVWGKDNLIVHKPLHVVQEQPAKDCVNNLIKTFGRYGAIKSLSEELSDVEARRAALSAAFKNQIIPRIGKREYTANEDSIELLERELLDIKANLAAYATNLSAVVNKEVLELKVQKDELLSVRLKLSGRLARIQKNLAENRHIKSKHFTGLVDFFPEIDQDRLVRVEEFHGGVAKLLRTELRDSERSLKDQIDRLDEAIAKIDGQMASVLRSVDKPAVLVDRVYGIAKALQTAKDKNDKYDADQELKHSIESLRERLTAEKTKVLEVVENTLNDGLRRVVTSVFGPERKSPRITLREKNYSYEVPEDTGTGTAYASLIMLDLTVFRATALPVLAHDSLLFKNIENDSAARLFEVYHQLAKQSFVAIDEIEKYGPKTAALLRTNSVIQLDNEHVLYIKDWRK